MIDVRKGEAQEMLDREQFRERFVQRFFDPAFEVEREAIGRLEEIAWQAYQEGRKAPRTRAAGPGHADPAYEASIEWLATSAQLQRAQQKWAAPATRSRVLVVCGSARNDGYPNHALDQTQDAMAEIYERWVAAHGVIIVAPTYWYQSPSVLKLMIDRLVCADGGNPDVTSTHGKTVAEAKQLEADGWHYPKHLAGRTFGLVVHGDVGGVESQRRNLADWLGWMGLVDAGSLSQLDRYIGYYEPYWNSHEALDRDQAVQAEARNVAMAVVQAVALLRRGALDRPDERVPIPRRK